MDFLRSLGVPEDVAKTDAEGMEHHVSPQTLAAFEKQYPEHVPDWPILRKLKFPGSDQAEMGEETAHVESTPLFVPFSAPPPS